MVYPTDEETFDERVSPNFISKTHPNLIQEFLKRLQDFLGYGGRLHDKFGMVMPPGGMIEWPDVDAIAGWLLCDGKQYNGAHSDYSDLYAVIGKKYGGGAASLFHVPDRRGYFTRGYSKIPSISFLPEYVAHTEDKIWFAAQKFYRTGFPVRFTTDDTLPPPLVINTTYFLRWSSVDWFWICTTRANAFNGIFIDLTGVGAGTSYVHPYIEEDKDSRLKLVAGGNDGEDLGSYQEDEFKIHRHETFNDANKVNDGPDFRSIRHVTGNDDSPTSYVGGVETRPRNVNVNYIIKR